MTRLYNAILAGVVASGIFSTILITPATAAKEHPTGKTTQHAKASHAAVPHAMTKSVTRARFEKRTHGSGVAREFSKTHSTRSPAFARPVMTRAAAMRLQDESSGRLEMIAHSKPPIRHVTMQRIALREITGRHVTLKNVTFLTGTVVRRERDFVVLRTSAGNEVPIATRVAVINQTAFVPGTTVVIPAQFANGTFTFVPAFTAAEEEETATLPAIAPCAVNDRDADDANDTSFYAPVAACQFNDGDSDDGFLPPALPAGFVPANVPTVFTSTYMPVVAAGFVVAQSGPDVVIMTPNFTPLVVNASAVMSSGAVNGPLTTGRYVTVYGYDVGNSLVATSIM